MKDHVVDLYLEHINADDPLQIIVRGHLYVESAMISLIESNLPNPTGIDFTKFNFHQKLEIAVALGLVKSDECHSLLQLNSLRNKLAHNLHIEFTDKSLTNITQSFDPESRELYKSFANGKIDLKDMLRVAITVLYDKLEVKRQVMDDMREEIRERIQQGLGRDISNADVNKFVLDVKKLP